MMLEIQVMAWAIVIVWQMDLQLPVQTAISVYHH